MEDILQLLKTCRKGTHMNCWETFYMQIFHQHKVLITEQQVNGTNPLYELANTTRIFPHNPQTVPHYIAHDTQPSQLHSQQRTFTQHGKQLPYNPYSLNICI